MERRPYHNLLIDVFLKKKYFSREVLRGKIDPSWDLVLYQLLVLVTSIQSFPQDAKTPVAEAASPLCEKPRILTNVAAPKESDFPQNEVDPYSELCSQQLDSLANLEEDLEVDKLPPTPKEKKAEAAVKPQQLEPLDLKQNEPKQQKLTTPGECRARKTWRWLRNCL